MRRLVDRYSEWLRQKMAVREIGEWVEITTPHLDRHNDCVQIYARALDNGYLLTDGGDTIGERYPDDCGLDGVLGATLAGLGVQLVGGELRVHASEDDFPLRLNNLLQAMLSVDSICLALAAMEEREDV